MIHSIMIKGTKLIRKSGEGTIFNERNEPIFQIHPSQKYTIDIFTNEDALFAKCTAISKSKLSFMSGKGAYVFLSNMNEEIIRIHYSGFSGLQRTLEYENNIYPFSRLKRKFIFADTELKLKHQWNGTLHAAIKDNKYFNQLVCIASYAWYRSDMQD